MEKGQKCLALTIQNEKPLWIVGRVHEILEMSTQKAVVVAVRKDYQKLVDGNGVIVLPPAFCFADIGSAGDFVNAVGQALDRFVAGYVPEVDTPPLVVDAGVIDGHAVKLSPALSPAPAKGEDQAKESPV